MLWGCDSSLPPLLNQIKYYIVTMEIINIVPLGYQDLETSRSHLDHSLLIKERI